jgi:hypothetical protein
MNGFSRFLITFVVVLLFFTVSKWASAWDHTVIMSPFEGSTYTVPLPQGRACIYVTDCTENILTQPTVPSAAPPPPSPPQEVSEIPTPGAYGWSFFDPIDRTEWALEVSATEESDSTKAELYKTEHAIDGDPNTIWHAPWVTPTGYPHWIIVDMKTQHWVDGMIITPRPYDETKEYTVKSNPSEYEVWVSNDKNAWSQVASGTLTYEPLGSPQKIEFLIPNLVQYVKLVILNSTGETESVTISEIEITESTKDLVITGGGVS